MGWPRRNATIRADENRFRHAAADEGPHRGRLETRVAFVSGPVLRQTVPTAIGYVLLHDFCVLVDAHGKDQGMVLPIVCVLPGQRVELFTARQSDRGATPRRSFSNAAPSKGMAVAA